MEEVLEDLYNRAQSNGYGKSKEDFTTLIYSNDDVLEDMYGYVQSKGYAKTKEDFENLIGKKKDFPEPASDSPLATGGLDSSENTPLNTGREIDTLSIQIADLEKQIQTAAEIPLSEEEEQMYPLGKPAVETPEMLELESLKKKRDELIDSTKKPGNELFDNTNIDEQKRKVGEIVSTDMELSRVNTSSPEYKDMVELLDRSESFVVPKLNYLYGDQGFKFEEADILGQKIKVTAKNGEKQRVNIGIGQNEEKRALELLEFIEKNKEASQALAKTVVGYEANQIKFRNDKVMDDAMSAFSKREDRFNKGAQLYSANSLKF